MKRLSKSREARYRYLDPRTGVKRIVQKVFEPTVLWPSEGDGFLSNCTNCPEPRCIYFTHSEISPPNLKVFSKFPRYPGRQVCPVDAISIDEATTSPEISSERCIGCSLCVMRCPIGAIYVDQKSQKAVLVNEESPRYLHTDSADDNDYLSTLRLLSNRENEFELSYLKKSYVIALMKSIERLRKMSSDFENIFLRNLLLQIDVPCMIRPVGDVNIRMDMFFEKGEIVGVGEINLDQASMIENPRNLLDDVAVLCSRYSVNKDNIVPIIMCNRFINRRSDFYELITDIENVLGIRIHTVSLLTLLLHYWHGMSIRPEVLKDKFVANREKPGISEDVSSLINGFANHPLSKSDFFMATK